MNPLDLYCGLRMPEWWTAECPPWAQRRDWEWYLQRAQVPGAVVAAAEAVAAATVTVIDPRGR